MMSTMISRCGEVQGEEEENLASQSIWRGVIPPDAPCLTMTFSSYTPSHLAAHFDLPVSLLPLSPEMTFPSKTHIITEFSERSFRSTVSILACPIRSGYPQIDDCHFQSKPKQREQSMSVTDLIEKTVMHSCLRGCTP